MTSDPWQLLEEATTVLVVHAHPDDESLSTGALLASLVAHGTRVVLVTATRGEEGEIVAGSVAPDDTRPIELIRDEEIDAATSALGLAERHMLGTAPALARAAAPRAYRDSGMQWVREGLAGPSDSAGASSFTQRPFEDAVADLMTLIEHVRPDVVIGYDDDGSYGHPDHVHAHHVTLAACRRTDTAMVEVASAEQADDTAASDSARDSGGDELTDFVWRDHPGTADSVRRAVDSYRTQLTVIDLPDADGTGDVDGIRIRHVGGQDDVVALRTGLRVRR